MARRRLRLVLLLACLALSAPASAIAPASGHARSGATRRAPRTRHCRAARRARHRTAARGCSKTRRHLPARHGTGGTTAPVESPAAASTPAGGPGPSGAGTTPATPSGGGTSPGGEAPAPPSVPHIQVTAVEYRFTLSRSIVPAGKVVLEFVNNGQDEHNLNAVSAEGELGGSFANTPSKDVRDLTVVLRHGTYTLFCSLPEHEQKGMKATLQVQ